MSSTCACPVLVLVQYLCLSSTLYSSTISIKFEFSLHNFEKWPNIEFNKNTLGGRRVFPCGRRGRQTDRRDEANGRSSQFCERAKKLPIPSSLPSTASLHCSDFLYRVPHACTAVPSSTVYRKLALQCLPLPCTAHLHCSAFLYCVPHTCTAVPSSTVYRKLAQQAGMPPWHWPRH